MTSDDDIELFPRFETLANSDERGLAALEPAWGKVATFFRTGHRFGHQPGSTRVLALHEINRRIEVFRTRFMAGDTLSLLQAIDLCAEENLPLPTWLAKEFSDRLSGFLNPGHEHSLDQVFSSHSIPTDTPKKAAAARQDWQLGVTLWRGAWDIAHKNKDIGTFNAVVDALLANGSYGVGKTKAKALIKRIEANQSQHLGKDLSLSRFLTKRRHLST